MCCLVLSVCVIDGCGVAVEAGGVACVGMWRCMVGVLWEVLCGLLVVLLRVDVCLVWC